MRVKRIGKGRYLIKIFKEEKIAESIINFCKEKRINSGTFYGIGAANSVELLAYNSQKKNYSSRVLEEDMEILNITGSVAFLDGKHAVHAHITLSDDKFNALGGHLKEGVISGTLELIFTNLRTKLSRKYDSETGLNLLDI